MEHPLMRREFIKRYIVGIVVSSILILLTYVHILFEPTLITKRVTLSEDPKYDYKANKGVVYWVDLSFYEIKDKLEITGTSYQYLEHPLFLKDVKKDSVVTITYSDDFIRQLSKDGYNYMDPVAANNHWEQNAMFARILFIVVFVTCIVPLLIRNIISERSFLLVTKYFAAILIPCLVIAYLITSNFIDEKYLGSSWTKYPIERRR